MAAKKRKGKTKTRVAADTTQKVADSQGFTLALGFVVGVAAGLAFCSKAPPVSGLG